MAGYYKLGKKAVGGSFSESTTGISVFGAKVVKLDAKAQLNKRVRKAIESGHLVPTTEEAYLAWEEKNAKQVADSQSGADKKVEEKKVDNSGSNEDDDDSDEDEADIYSMNKAELVAHASEMEGNELSTEELEAMKKAEIIEHIEGLSGDSE